MDFYIVKKFIKKLVIVKGLKAEERIFLLVEFCSKNYL